MLLRSLWYRKLYHRYFIIGRRSNQAATTASREVLLRANCRNDIGDILHLRVEGYPKGRGAEGVERAVFSTARNDADVDVGLLVPAKPTQHAHFFLDHSIAWEVSQNWPARCTPEVNHRLEIECVSHHSSSTSEKNTHTTLRTMPATAKTIER